jgi:hypothetical protein
MAAWLVPHWWPGAAGHQQPLVLPWLCFTACLLPLLALRQHQGWNMAHPVAILCRCALCDSYFLTQLGSIQLAEYRGKKGKAALQDQLEKMQARFERGIGDGHEDQRSDRAYRDARAASANTYDWLRCPTCVEATHGMRYAEWLAQGGVYGAATHTAAHGGPEPEAEPEPQQLAGQLQEDRSVLSPCEYVSFEDDQPPPLYMDGSSGKGKPKWKLVQGVGPPGLEVDSSRSGRLHKPSLRPFGIETPMYRPLLEEEVSLSPAGHQEVATLVFEAMSARGGMGWEELFGFAPLYRAWQQPPPSDLEYPCARGRVEAAAAAAEAASAELHAVERGTLQGKPAARLAAASGLGLKEARAVVRRARAGDAEACAVLLREIAWIPPNQRPARSVDDHDGSTHATAGWGAEAEDEVEAQECEGFM